MINLLISSHFTRWFACWFRHGFACWFRHGFAPRFRPMTYICFYTILSLLMMACTTHPSFTKRTRSPHFKEGRFHNVHDAPLKGMWKAIWMRLSTDWADWPEWVEIQEDQTQRYRL